MNWCTTDSLHLSDRHCTKQELEISDIAYCVFYCSVKHMTLTKGSMFYIEETTWKLYFVGFSDFPAGAFNSFEISQVAILFVIVQLILHALSPCPFGCSNYHYYIYPWDPLAICRRYCVNKTTTVMLKTLHIHISNCKYERKCISSFQSDHAKDMAMHYSSAVRGQSSCNP